jgi:integrase
MTQVCPRHIQKEKGSYWLRVPAGKDTQSGTGEPRDAFLPDAVEREMLELQYSEQLDDDDAYFPVTSGRVRQMVWEAAEDVASHVEDGADLPGSASDWQKVSSHDLRRFFAHSCLVRRAMNPRVVMEVGGWSSFSAIEPYLNKPTKQNIAEEFRS